MDVVTLTLSKSYVDKKIDALPVGMVYKGAVRIRAQLPTPALEVVGHVYTVLFKDDQVTPWNKQFVCGDYQGTLQWTELGSSYDNDIAHLVANKVDKVSGKELSSNDFSNTYKDKLDDIEAGAQKNLPNTVTDANYKHISVTNSSVSDGTITFNKYDDSAIQASLASVASRTSALETGSATKSELSTVTSNLNAEILRAETAEATKANTADVTAALANKVDTVAGKGLSTNDYTTAEKEKLAGIETGAQKNLANTVVDANYKHINVTLTSVSDGIVTFDKYNDTAIQSSLSAVSTRVGTIEADYLKTADKTALQTNIDNEETRRQNADATLQINIDNEKNARASGDSTTLYSAKSYTNTAIADMVTMSDAQTISGAKTFSAETQFRKADDRGGYLVGGSICPITTSNTIAGISLRAIAWNTSSRGYYYTGINLMYNTVTNSGSVVPLSSNFFDLGTSSKLFKNIYLAGTITDGTNSFLVSDIASKAQITSEANTRAAADTTLQTNINNEATARQNADTALSDRIDNLEALGRYLTTWHAETGKPDTEPPVELYELKTGDYYLIASVGTTNYKPIHTVIEGVPYLEPGQTSTVVETADLSIGDTYLFDRGNLTWTLLHTPTKIASWGSITGTLSNQTDLQTALNGKVNTNGTDRLMTASEGTKLAGIETGAEVNTITSIKMNGSIITPVSKVVDLGDIAEEAGVTALAARVTTAEGNITNLQTTVGNASSGLVKGLADETTARTNADTTLQANITAEATARAAADATKVDKVEGKGLSTNDYTTAEQTKLAGIATGAQVNTIESIKLNGSTVTPVSKVIDLGNLATSAALTSLTTRVSTAEGNISTLQTTTGTLTTGLSTETTNRTNADTALATNLATEVSRSEAADTALGNRITAIETDYLKTADKTALQNEINLKLDITDYNAITVTSTQISDSNGHTFTHQDISGKAEAADLTAETNARTAADTALTTAVAGKQNKVFHQAAEPTTAVTGDIWVDDGYEGATPIVVGDIVDDLTSTAANKPLSANQGRVLNTTKQNTLTAGSNITISDNTISATNTTYSAGNGLTLTGTTFSANVQNNLTSTSTTDALSANQGKVLAGKLTDGSVTKVGTSTVGSTTKPIYLNAGTPTASNATVGSSSQPVYLNGGTITACTAYSKGSWANVAFSGSSGVVFAPASGYTFSAHSSHGCKYRQDTLGRIEITMGLNITTSNTIAANSYVNIGTLNKNSGCHSWFTGILAGNNKYIPVGVHITDGGTVYLSNTTSSAVTLNSTELQVTILL